MRVIHDMEPTPPPRYSDSSYTTASTMNEEASVPSEAPSGVGQERPVNVLILGEMANGKSTLIRQLQIYAGNVDPDIRIGFGNVACTKDVGRYNLSTSLRPYHLRDHSGQEVKNVKYSELVKFTEDDATAEAGAADEGGKLLNFELLDTPGLDDSDGNDMEIMTQIIAKIGGLTHMNAVIYVRHLSRPFGTYFTRFYDYIQRCMPMISSGLIVAHTGFTIDKVDEALFAERDLAAERKAVFEKATKGQMSLARFFMDNNPDEINPFAASQSLNGCYKLLRFLSTQLPLDISNLKLLKAPNMANVDAHVLFALERHHRKLKTSLDAELTAATKSKQKLMRTKREIARLKAKKEDYQSELADLDRPNETVLGTKTVAEDYGFNEFFFEGSLWLDKRDVQFDSDCIITRVQKSVGSGCKWLDEDLRGTSWRAKLKSRIFRSMEGSATFYTTSQLKHKGEIEHLKARLKDIAHDISYHEKDLADMSSTEEADSATEKLAEDVDRCSATVERVQRDTFEAVLWPLLRRFYVSHGVPLKSDIVEFVEIYDPRTAEMLMTF